MLPKDEDAVLNNLRGVGAAAVGARAGLLGTLVLVHGESSAPAGVVAGGRGRGRGRVDLLQADLGLGEHAVHNRGDLVKQRARRHVGVDRDGLGEDLNLKRDRVRGGGAGRERRMRRRRWMRRRGRQRRRRRWALGACARVLRRCEVAVVGCGRRPRGRAQEQADAHEEGKAAALHYGADRASAPAPTLLGLLVALHALLARTRLAKARLCGGNDARRKPELKVVAVVVGVVPAQAPEGEGGRVQPRHPRSRAARASPAEGGRQNGVAERFCL